MMHNTTEPVEFGILFPFGRVIAVLFLSGLRMMDRRWNSPRRRRTTQVPLGCLRMPRGASPSKTSDVRTVSGQKVQCPPIGMQRSSSHPDVQVTALYCFPWALLKCFLTLLRYFPALLCCVPVLIRQPRSFRAGSHHSARLSWLAL